jgi:uncharacterized membrane protein
MTGIYTQPAGEVVAEGLLDLLAGVHHEGAVLVAIIAPTVLASGLAEALAALASALVALRTKNVLVAMVVGVGAVWVLRTVLK